MVGAALSSQAQAGAGWFRRLPVFVLPVVIGVIQVMGTRGAAADQPERVSLDGLAFTLLLAGPLLLLARRRYPVLVLGVVLGVTLGYFALDYPYGPVFLSVIAALAGAVLRGHRLVAWASAGLAYVVWLLVQTLPGGPPAPGLIQAAGVAAWVLVVLMTIEGLRIRAERTAERAWSQAERERRQASEQRLQIARELHDVLAHNISLINVQASVALHLLGEQPDAARGALTTIKQASKDVLTEMRSVLGVLRAEDETAPRLPAPSLTQLDELVARGRDAGLDLHTEVRGEPVSLPASVDAAAYRILQEALTNAARHGSSAPTTALITYQPSALTVQVDNQTAVAPTAPALPSAGGYSTGRYSPGEDSTGEDSTGEHSLEEESAGDGTGSGISGMRERVTALGGTLSAGLLPGGREFRVLASFPLAPHPPEDET